jgi:REP element-mobilizing transposase RayT
MAGRARKKQVQLQLPKLDKNGQRRGGKRRGAGRPAKGPRPSEKHKTRRRLLASQPVHVIFRVADDIKTLRTRQVYAAIREATITAAAFEDCRIVHFSIQRGHLHLICEAKNRTALATGMQGFAISAARHINRALGRKGTVFPDRYHVVILETPRQVRNCVTYVMNNWRHHGEDRAPFAKKWLVDPFSSGLAFSGWKELEGAAVMWKPSVDTYQSLITWHPKTWLLREGWLRHGRVGATEVPGGGAE